MKIWFDSVLPQHFLRLPPEAVGKIEQAIRWVGDAIVIGLAVVVAIMSAFAAQYFDQTFGTIGQYIALLLIDAGAATAVTGVTDTLKELLKPVIS